MRRAGLAALAALALGCGERGAPAQAPKTFAAPVRAGTVGDAILARAPAGADWCLELDLARLRANPTVGAAVTALVDGDAPALPSAVTARGADAVVLVGYRTGTAEAHTITFVRGGTRPAEAVRLDGELWAVTDEGQTAALLAVAPGRSAVDDLALMAVRAEAMPAAADGASVRLAARLDGEASAGLGELLELGAPRAVSAWLDVADDLAAIVVLEGGDGAALGRWRDRLAALTEVRALGLAPALADARLERAGAVTRATVVVGPRRLARAVERWQAVGSP